MQGAARLIITGILQRYLLMDEHLNNEMCWQFFPRRTYPALWRTKRFRAFSQCLLDRLSLLHKLEFVRTRVRVPKQFCEDIRALNTLRNSVAHSFFPENRTKGPKWKGSDIFEVAGYGQFFTDTFNISKFFFGRFHRQERQRRRTP